MCLYNILCDEMDSLHQAFLLHSELWWLSPGKAIVQLFEWRAELATFFFFLVESYFYWQANYGYSDRGIWQTFSWKLRCEPCQFKKNNLAVFIASDKSQAFKWKLEFWKLVSTPVSLISCQYLKTFQMRLLVILTNVIWGILCNEMCQHLHNSVNQYFWND